MGIHIERNSAERRHSFSLASVLPSTARAKHQHQTISGRNPAMMLLLKARRESTARSKSLHTQNINCGLSRHLAVRRNLRSFAMDFDEEPSAPMEVDWSSELANSVNLIGNLGADPQISYLPSGRVVAKMSVAVAAYGNKTNWFECEMWNNVAKSAQIYLNRGSKVHVTGRLEKDVWTDKLTGTSRSKIKVLVTSFNTVRPYAPMAPGGDYGGGGMMGGERYGDSPLSSKGEQRPAEEKWSDFFNEPDQYWDNRALKASGERSPRYPDFKHKTTQEALWVDSWDSPKWIQETLTLMDKAAKEHQNGGYDDESVHAGEEVPGESLPPQW